MVRHFVPVASEISFNDSVGRPAFETNVMLLRIVHSQVPLGSVRGLHLIGRLEKWARERLAMRSDRVADMGTEKKDSKVLQVKWILIVLQCSSPSKIKGSVGMRASKTLGSRSEIFAGKVKGGQTTESYIVIMGRHSPKHFH